MRRLDRSGLPNAPDAQVHIRGLRDSSRRGSDSLDGAVIPALFIHGLRWGSPALTTTAA